MRRVGAEPHAQCVDHEGDQLTAEDIGRGFILEALGTRAWKKICQGGSLSVSYQQLSSISLKVFIEETLRT